ncbi:MAG: DNA-directed RNA polymerase subunit omega [Acidimicrobiales bacterium]|nr:DNA-directed RNA polymerase subunit omega [Acidimicrobiales bacterium]
MMEPPIEDLLEAVGSKFTLVTLSSMRGRQINSYFNQLGEGLGAIAPPQVTSVARKPLSIAMEEIAAGKIKVKFLDSSELTTDDAVENAAEVAAESTSEVVAEVALEVAPEVVAEVATESTPEVAPEDATETKIFDAVVAPEPSESSEG